MWVVLVIVAVLVLVFTALRGMASAATRGEALTDITMSPDLAQRVRELVEADRQILAVKILREETGASLLAAKRITDRMRLIPPRD